MDGYVQIGQQLHYTLTEALLIYRCQSHSGGGEAFITRNPVNIDSSNVPQLGPGEAISMGFLKDLLRSTSRMMRDGFLPENILAHGYERISWWVKPAIRPMFYAQYATTKTPELQFLSGKKFPQPALLFNLSGNRLSIRALAEAERPTPDTKLYRAPYWNVSDNGEVCLGDTRVPDGDSIESLDRWEASFFESAFSHPNSQEKLTNHPKGFIGLWRELAGKKNFPVKYLASSNQTLAEFLGLQA